MIDQQKALAGLIERANYWDHESAYAGCEEDREFARIEAGKAWQHVAEKRDYMAKESAT